MGKCKVCGVEVFPDCPELADDLFYCSTQCIIDYHGCEGNEFLSTKTHPTEYKRESSRTKLPSQHSIILQPIWTKEEKERIE